MTVKRIAVLTCLDACKVCTGASCLTAWNRRERGFAPYAGEEASLEAFFHCNGCGTDPETDEGMREKLDRLQSIGVDVGTLCPAIAAIRDMLHARGIETVVGTH